MSDRRRLPILAVFAVFLVSACGFEPLYATRDISATEEMAAISVQRIRTPEPAAYLVQEALDRRLTPNRKPDAPEYELTVRLREARQPLAIQLDSSVTRFNYRLSADYQLLDAVSRRPLYRSAERSITSFNVVTSQYATLVGEREAQKKAAEQVSSLIATKLALYFSLPPEEREGKAQETAPDPMPEPETEGSEREGGRQEDAASVILLNKDGSGAKDSPDDDDQGRRD